MEVISIFYLFIYSYYDIKIDYHTKDLHNYTYRTKDLHNYAYRIISKNKHTIAKLFAIGSHHRNTNIIPLTQNIFHQNQHPRTVNLNNHYNGTTELILCPVDLKYLRGSYYGGKNNHT